MENRLKYISCLVLMVLVVQCSAYNIIDAAQVIKMKKDTLLIVLTNDEISDRALVKSFKQEYSYSHYEFIDPIDLPLYQDSNSYIFTFFKSDIKSIYPNQNTCGIKYWRSDQHEVTICEYGRTNVSLSDGDFMFDVMTQLLVGYIRSMNNALGYCSRFRLSNKDVAFLSLHNLEILQKEILQNKTLLIPSSSFNSIAALKRFDGTAFLAYFFEGVQDLKIEIVNDSDIHMALQKQDSSVLICMIKPNLGTGKKKEFKYKNSFLTHDDVCIISPVDGEHKGLSTNLCKGQKRKPEYINNSSKGKTDIESVLTVVLFVTLVTTFITELVLSNI